MHTSKSERHTKKAKKLAFYSCYYYSQKKKKSWTNVLRFKQRNLSTAVPFFKFNGRLLAVVYFQMFGCVSHIRLYVIYKSSGNQNAAISKNFLLTKSKALSTLVTIDKKDLPASFVLKLHCRFLLLPNHFLLLEFVT